MKHVIITALLIISAGTAFSQSSFSKQELSMNGFRSPSIGLEYRYQQVSVHAGYYVSNFKSGITTQFVKAGLTGWFLPVDKKEIPSSFYAGVSYLRGLNRNYEDKNAVGLEAGFRWMIWKGLNLRAGGIAVAAKGEGVKINPAFGVTYSFKF
jgi:hypothetical protein